MTARMIPPYAALRERVRLSPSAPVITFRDLATGERMELSAASLDNAVAKTAGLMRDELDVQPGSRVGVHLPLHWQRVVWLGACAATGAIFAPDADPASCDVLVVDRDHLDLLGGGDGVVVSLAPFGLPEPGGVPMGAIDAAVAMRAHPDTFVAYDEPDSAQPLLAQIGGEVLTGAQAWAAAEAELRARGLARPSRFAIIDPDPAADLLALAGALGSDGAAVLIAHPTAGDVAAVLAAEGIRATE